MSKSQYDRRYLGVTITADNYREILVKEGRGGINFHTKHLKSYLSGRKTFTYEWNYDEGGQPTSPKVHRVQQTLVRVNKGEGK